MPIQSISEETLKKSEEYISTVDGQVITEGVRKTSVRTCQHPGCDTELQLNEFHIGERVLNLPACAFCDEHVKLYQYGKDKKTDDRIQAHRTMWDKYASFDPLLAPTRRIEHFPIGSRIGHEISDKDAISLIAGSHKGCLLQGDTGLGKTFFLFALSDHLVRTTGTLPLVCYAPRLRMELSEAATSDHSSDKTRLINKLVGAGRLFIDDIGSSSMTESFEESIKMVVEERGKSVPILPIFTSIQQTSKEFIHGRGGDNQRRAAIIRRLCEDCLIFKFTRK
jgi:DNA replication protein DnaC